MSGLQQVLIIIAILVIVGLFFLNRMTRIVAKDTPEQGSLGEAKHSSEVGQDSFSEESIQPEVDKNQTSLAFGGEFEVPERAGVSFNAAGSSNKYLALEIEDSDISSEVNQYRKPEYKKLRLDVSKGNNQSVIKPQKNQDHQVFVLMVLCTTGSEFSMVELNQALLGVGLKFIEQKAIYVKKDNIGNEVIKVANILEPGVFPTTDLENYTTSGIAMILELPSTIRAPAAMHDLIMMARKVTQKMQGRLYSIERHLIKESDLQTMRDKAIEYETEPL